MTISLFARIKNQTNNNKKRILMDYLTVVFFAFMWVCCFKMKRDGGGGSGVWRSCDRSSELSLIADQGL